MILDEHASFLDLAPNRKSTSNAVNTTPEVSICIPIYNGSQYLRTCLSSAISQTHEDIEILAIDDGSTDNSVEIIKEFARHDSRVRVLRNSNNLGLVGNWNQCITQSRGKWIKFLFQDDVIEANCVQKMVDAGERTQRPLVIARRDFIYEEVPRAIVEEYQKFTTTISMDNAAAGQVDLSPEFVSRLALRFRSANFIGEPTSTLISRAIFERIGLFNSAIIQLCDLEFFLRVGTNYGLAYVPETLTHFRIHNESTTSKNSSSKEFLKDTIDPLILYREFAFSEHYATVRAEALKSQINLSDQFYQNLVNARLAIESESERSRYLLGQASKISIIESAFDFNEIPYRTRLGLRLGIVFEGYRRLFNRHIGWRFRQK